MRDEASQDEERSDEDDSRATQRRRRVAEADNSDDDEGTELVHEELDGDGDKSKSQLVKKLVRYALACEFSRQPIRRDGIREKGPFLCRIIPAR